MSGNGRFIVRYKNGRKEWLVALVNNVIGIKVKNEIITCNVSYTDTGDGYFYFNGRRYLLKDFKIIYKEKLNGERED
jgi:hypothetical protein